MRNPIRRVPRYWRSPSSCCWFLAPGTYFIGFATRPDFRIVSCRADRIVLRRTRRHSATSISSLRCICANQQPDRHAILQEHRDRMNHLMPYDGAQVSQSGSRSGC